MFGFHTFLTPTAQTQHYVMIDTRRRHTQEIEQAVLRNRVGDSPKYNYRAVSIIETVAGTVKKSISRQMSESAEGRHLSLQLSKVIRTVECGANRSD